MFSVNMIFFCTEMEVLLKIDTIVFALLNFVPLSL